MPRDDAANTVLTAAEVAVVNGILAGDSNEVIARRRGTSPRTVANQVASVFRKQGVGSRGELMARHHVGACAALRRAASSLTRREREIVERAVIGQSNKQVGYELGLAPSTVAGHLAKAAAKLGTGSRIELIAMFTGSADPSGTDDTSSIVDESSSFNVVIRRNGTHRTERRSGGHTVVRLVTK